MYYMDTNPYHVLLGHPKRIDYILTMPKIAEIVEAAGILELKAYSDSDHRALYADIDMAAFLGLGGQTKSTRKQHVKADFQRIPKGGKTVHCGVRKRTS
jgi:hypothetical protein